MHVVGTQDLRSWLEETGDLGRLAHGIGAPTEGDDGYLAETLGFPIHLELTVGKLLAEHPDATLDLLASIPFYSLCRGLLLPLSGLAPERVAHLFGFRSEDTLDTVGREALLARFFGADLGLDLEQKLAVVLGDPYRGQNGGWRRDGLVRLLGSVELKTERQQLDRLTVVGDVAVLFAESRPTLKQEPPLTSTEVLESIRLSRGIGKQRATEVARSLLQRCGKLEAYFLAKLLQRKAGFGFEYQGPLLARVIGETLGAPPEQVAHAMALTDPFKVARALRDDGIEGLKRIQLKPLVPVRPALASGGTDKIDAWPAWVERKYDGIRFMLHKSTARGGNVLCGAYTRGRRDWMELVPGMDATIRALPAHNVILDGELHAIAVGPDGTPRPATVYEVYGLLQGEGQKRPLRLQFAAFDVLYLEGRDLTGLPLAQRRQVLQNLVGPLQNLPTAVPIRVAEGQLCESMDDVNRLYGHFRAQGYEGVIVKDLRGPYLLAQRDPTWLKRKPVITLDLVLLGAVFAVTTKEKAGAFGSYVIGARGPDNAFVDVGDVAGVDQERDAQIQGEILREGLITGRRIERQSASGKRPGMDLRPSIVVTVKFEGVVKDDLTEAFSLRGPKVVQIRSDKTAAECDTVKDLERIWLKERMG